MNGTNAPDDPEVSFEDCLNAIGVATRRKLLLALAAHEPPPAEAVVDGEEWADGDRATWIGLLHVHLPLLEHYGFVEWDRATREITTGPNFQDVESLLGVLDAHQDELPGEWP